MKEKLPFAIQKHYTTPMEWRQVAKFMESRKSKKGDLWIFQNYVYKVSVENRRFTLKKISYSRRRPHYPTVEGVVVSESPLVLKIKIIPNYWLLIFYIIFPLVFIYPLVFISFSLLQEMITNGDYRAPELWERFFMALFGVGFPLLLGWFNLIRPIRQTELWLMDKLSLSECDSKPLDD